MYAKKIFFTLLLGLSFFGSTYVYSNFYRAENIIFKNTYLPLMYSWNHEILSKNFVVFESNQDLSGFSISWWCRVRSKLLPQTQSQIYVFEMILEEENCKNPHFLLQDSDGKSLTNTFFRVDITSYVELFNLYTDFTSQRLRQLLTQLEKHKEQRILFSRLQNLSLDNEMYRKYFDFHQIEYQKNLIKNILENRTEKYTIPVAGFELPTLISKLPNSGRPYRADHTYWIHEGWDIDTKKWQEVIAIDDGIILRVVDGFLFEDLQKIKRKNLSHRDKLLNLDILRGNQVWLKTNKWDVIFYWHLNEVNKNISEWQVVKRWQSLGTVGISGVPDLNYTDFHLHFELRQNPYNHQKAGKYTFEEYMDWDWYFKWKNSQYIIQNQYTIFQK